MITILNVKRMNVKFGKNLYRQINTKKKTQQKALLATQKGQNLFISVNLYVLVSRYLYLLLDSCGSVVDYPVKFYWKTCA